MEWHYTNPDHWGKSPLTDNALQRQQRRAENPAAWEEMIEEDVDALTAGDPIVTPDPLLLTDANGTRIAFSHDPYYFPTEETHGDDCPDIIYYTPSNDSKAVGFPEGQILPHCNGDADLCGDLSATYHLGDEFPLTGNNALDSVCERLTRTDDYGAYKDYNVDF